MRGAERSQDPATGTLGPVLAAWCSHPSQTWTIQCQESPRGSFSPAARAVTTGCPGAKLTSGSHRLQVPRLDSQAPGSSIRPVARWGDRALGSRSELGPVFALGGVSSFISYKRRMRKRGVSGCLYLSDRDRGQGRRPISLPSSPLLGLSSSQTLQAASPPCYPQAGTKGWGGTGPPPRLRVPDLPPLSPSVQGLPLSSPQGGNRMSLQPPLGHCSSQESYFCPRKALPGYTGMDPLKERHINILKSVHSDHGQKKYSLRE